MTLEHLHQGASKIHNRVIERIFRELGIIEQWRSGIQKILTSCKEAGLETPKLEEVGNNFRVMLFKRRIAPPIIDAIEERILTLLKEGGALSTKLYHLS